VLHDAPPGACGPAVGCFARLLAHVQHAAHVASCAMHLVVLSTGGKEYILNKGWHGEHVCHVEVQRMLRTRNLDPGGKDGNFETLTYRVRVATSTEPRCATTQGRRMDANVSLTLALRFATASSEIPSPAPSVKLVHRLGAPGRMPGTCTMQLRRNETGDSYTCLRLEAALPAEASCSTMPCHRASALPPVAKRPRAAFQLRARRVRATPGGALQHRR